MKFAGILGIGAFALTLVGAPALSTTSATSSYSIAMQIHYGDRLVGSPKLTVAAGQPSTIAIEEAAGNRYNVTMTAMSQAGDTVLVKSEIDVVSGGVHQAISPRMLVAFNKSSAIAFGVDSAASKPIRVDFTINKIS